MGHTRHSTNTNNGQSRGTGNMGHTRHSTNTTQNTKQMSNTDPNKKPRMNPFMLARDKQFLPLIKDPACYQSSQ